MSSFYVNLALSILFSVIEERELLPRFERAFLKLHKYIGIAYGLDQGEENQLPLDLEVKGE